MPFGCGEQNMVQFAPNIFVLQYLKKTKQLDPKIEVTALYFLRTGKQRPSFYSGGEKKKKSAINLECGAFVWWVSARQEWKQCLSCAKERYHWV